MLDLQKLYDIRFNSLERIRKDTLWRIMCECFLQQFIKRDDAVLDLGAGQCEFINNIICRKKYALDPNPENKKCANTKVTFILGSGKQIKNRFPAKSLDVIFMSNLLEHLDSKEEIFRLINEAYSVLKIGGRLLIMQPDINLVGHSYWDFFDHKLPITYASCVEVLKANKFRLSFSRYPFMPYSTKVRFLPAWPLLLRIYIKFRPLHYLFGKQFFILASKK